MPGAELGGLEVAALNLSWGVNWSQALIRLTSAQLSRWLNASSTTTQVRWCEKVALPKLTPGVKLAGRRGREQSHLLRDHADTQQNLAAAKGRAESPGVEVAGLRVTAELCSSSHMACSDSTGQANS